MIKFMFVGRRAPGTTRAGALGHLRDVHGKMVVCAPVDAGVMPLDYVQNHVIDGAYPGAGEHAIDRDFVTELWFGSFADLHSSTATPYYLDNLRPDEPHFVDDATVAKMMVRPTTLLEGEGTRFKAFLFIGRASVDDGAWDAGRAAAAAAFSKAPGILAAVENMVLAPSTSAISFVDTVFEGWFATIDDATASVARFEDYITAFGGDVAAPARSFAVFAEQYDTPRLRALHGCARPE